MDTDSTNTNLRRGKMVTLEKNTHSDKLSLSGLSTDTKPTQTFQGQKIVNGSSFLEIDTQNVFFYDEQNHQWPDPS